MKQKETAANDNANILISLDSICKGYGSGELRSEVLRGLSLDIFEHEFLAITGESGCGKTTLLNILGGIDRPDGGAYLFDGVYLNKFTDKALGQFRRTEVGYVFQSYRLMPNLTAIENLRIISELKTKSGNPEAALKMVGLQTFGGHFPHQLSGGQQQRVSIARAVVKRPRLIVADEPTAALDHETAVEVLETFEKLIHSRKTTLVLVTHNPEITRMADRVVRLKDGAVHSVFLNPRPSSARELLW